MKISTGQDHTLAFIVSYYAFKIATVVISGVSIYLGYRLFILGVTGQASLVVKSATVSGQLLNAAPGLFFGVGGLVTLGASIWKGVEIQVGRDNDARAYMI
jgi:hypothetical protein